MVNRKTFLKNTFLHGLKSAKSAGEPISDILWDHFGRIKLEELTVSERQFPFRVRADLQRAVEQVTRGDWSVLRFSGVRKTHNLNSLDLASLFVAEKNNQAVAVPPQYEDVEIGEEKPVKCLQVGLWLMEYKGTQFAVLLSPLMEAFTTTGIRFQIATLNDAVGEGIAEQYFDALEKSVSDCRSYRGKILSLESTKSYSGKFTGIKVHKLRTVGRDQIILPKKTLTLLERNIIRFSQQREALSKLGQATKKGILFYGPPGTGKSHTIHYLAGVLKGQTMLLITAEQVALLSEYMSLARLLQPSIVVIEDVDLIARDRTQMNTCDQTILNKLLNEMDGLKESADILFILTTNRPEALEAALASRPGRVDQAIEFPLPDEDGRTKLIHLYGQGMTLSDELVRTIVNRTEDVSAAFIKELMRRSVQFQLERNGAANIELNDIDNALNEMLFSGGSLNVKLLGGSRKIGFQ
jgi:cell division protease FtsH